MADWTGVDNFLATGFGVQLARAWAWTVWPHVMSGSRVRAFSANDLIRLLAHNLDFWVPVVTAMIQEHLQASRSRQGENGRPGHRGGRHCIARRHDQQPRTGGQVWFGEPTSAPWWSRPWRLPISRSVARP